MNTGKYFFSCMFLALFAIACGPSSKPSSGTAQFVEPDPGGVASPVDIRGEVDTIRQRYVYDMGNSEGVIIANIGDEVDRPLLIYDKGHKLWLKTSFEGEYSENLMKLAPFAKDVETYLLVFKCMGKVDGYYGIIVNEEAGEIRYVSSTDRSFRFQGWADHILTCFSVGFYHIDNPIRTEPLDGAETIAYSKDEFYHPVKVEGNWLKVKWGYDEAWSYGWIRWRDGDSLILELFYSA